MSYTCKKFPIFENEIQIDYQVAQPNYCESAGRKGAIFGYDTGVFETWVYPFKIVSDLKFSVNIPDKNLNIACTEIASRCVVRPELTTIYFSHELFLIKLHLLTPLHQEGSIFLFDVDTDTPLEICLSFIPNLIPMWPAGLGGQYTLWSEEINGYFIGEGTKKYVGLIGSPFGLKKSETPGHQLPEGFLKFIIPVNSEQTRKTYFPIFVAGSDRGREIAIKNYQNLEKSVREIYLENYNYYLQFQTKYLTFHSPDPTLNLSFEWAKIALDKGIVENTQLGTGLAAGFNVSGQTHRPGFGWFFGGDTCVNGFALNCYGDFESLKKGLSLLRKYQREDGKIPHEITQSASLIKWFEEYPYCYYHADTTPYYIIAMFDYLKYRGDLNFIKESWESIKKAFDYCEKSDEDGDGIMENSAAGLAAMEVGKMIGSIKVDIYLAAVWIFALGCLIELSEFAGDLALKKKCQRKLDKATKTFESIFIDRENSRLKFSVLKNDGYYSDATVWQSIPLFFRLINPELATTNLKEFASPAMNTDWGTRSLTKLSEFYDPVNYNNGAVWPFTTGFVAAAQYRSHRAINGFQNLMANARLTFIDSPGWHTELLSGEFYKPISQSVPHQLFSASGIIIPVVLGLLGLECDFLKKEIKFAPHLPFQWNELIVENYRCGNCLFNFRLKKSNNHLKLEFAAFSQTNFSLLFSPSLGIGARIFDVKVNGKMQKINSEETLYDTHCRVECAVKEKTVIDISYDPGIEFDIPLPEIKTGSRSQGLKLEDYQFKDKILKMQVHAPGGKKYSIPFRTGFKIKKVLGAVMRKIENRDYLLLIDFGNVVSVEYERKEIVLYFV